MAGLNDIKTLAGVMLDDFEHYRHVFLTVTPTEMADLAAQLEGLKGRLFDATDPDLQSVFPVDIMGQGQFLIQLRLGQVLARKPGRAYLHFLKSTHRKMILALDKNLLDAFNGLLSTFMAPEEASRFASFEQPSGEPLVCEPKANAYGVYVIESFQPSAP